MDTSIQGIRSDIQGQNAYMQEILLYIRKNGCSCLCGKSEQWNKDHTNRKQCTLGQDIFQLYHHINLTSEIPYDYKGTESDIVMMDDGKVIMCVPYQRRLLIFKTVGSYIESIPVQGVPWCVTALNNSTVAVTLYDSGCVEMYDINNKLKLKSISPPGMEYDSCITTINNKLVVGGEKRLLIIDHQTGEVVKTIHTDYDPYMLHGSGDRIFYNGFYYINNNMLYCYRYTDDRQHTLTLPSTPLSMTTLQDGSLYVGCKDGSVQHVSSDIKQFTTVKTKGLEKLECLAYNPKQRQLITKNTKQEKFNVFYHVYEK